MSELAPEEEAAAEPADDGNVAHPVPVDSAAARVGDDGTPAGSLPPVLGS